MQQESSSQQTDRAETLAAHVRLANPQATAEERRAAQQARVGILRNPAEPKLVTPPPRDVWRKWPRLRSSRRNGTTGSILHADIARRVGADGPATAKSQRPDTPDAQALHSQSRALRQALHVQQVVDPLPPGSGAPGPGSATGNRRDAALTPDRQRRAKRAGLLARSIAMDADTTAVRAEGPDLSDKTPQYAPPPSPPGATAGTSEGALSMVQDQPRKNRSGLRSQGRNKTGQRHPWPQRIFFALAWGGFCAVIGGVVLRLLTGP